MTFNPFGRRGKQFRSWRELDVAPVDSDYHRHARSGLVAVDGENLGKNGPGEVTGKTMTHCVPNKHMRVA